MFLVILLKKMSGNSVQKLQVIDPAVLKSLLEQLNANVKRQTVANMAELIHDYDKFLAQPEKSSLKDSLRQNLYSRIQQHKNNRKKRSQIQNLTTETQTENQSGEQRDNQNDREEMTPHATRLSAKFHAQSVKHFEKRLEAKGFKSSKDGFLVANGKKKNNIPYEDVLNDFGRNIKSKSNFRLSEQEKRTIRLLSDSGFAQYLIPNRQLKLAYGTSMPDIREHLIAQTSPMKKRPKTKRQGGEVTWEKVKRQIYSDT